MVRHLTVSQLRADYADRPDVDDRDLAVIVPVAVAEVLDVAETWLCWDGRPVYAEGNAWTPHKALRRVADHLLDHLAEIECRLAGQPTRPDEWHGRMVTTDADFARFTEVDLDEATSRLTRLAACYQALLAGLDPQALDARPDDATWTIREVVHHVGHVTAYAEMVGRLGQNLASSPVPLFWGSPFDVPAEFCPLRSLMRQSQVQTFGALTMIVASFGPPAALPGHDHGTGPNWPRS